MNTRESASLLLSKRRLYFGAFIFIFCLSAFSFFSSSDAAADPVRSGEWRKDKIGWRYQNADSRFFTNEWQEIEGKWYFFGEDGYMASGRWVGDYYLGRDGAMLVNSTTPDGYRVDQNGKWIPSVPKAKDGYQYMDSEEFIRLLGYGFSRDEADLYLLLNAYREDMGLPKLSLSKSLTNVARTHVKDSNTYHPENQKDIRGMQANLHSWSYNGHWRGVNYTPDHHYAELMWSKPSEITSYTGNGYEISVWTSASYLSPSSALKSWQGSAGHNDVILGAGAWSDLKTVGIGIEGSYAHVWFGKDPDPAGYFMIRDYDVVYP